MVLTCLILYTYNHCLSFCKMYLPYFPNLQIGKNNIFWTTRCILFAFSFKINAVIYFKIFKIFLGMAFQTPASKLSHHQHSPYLLVCNFLTDRLATIQIYYRKFRRDYCASTDFSLYRSNLYKFQTYTATVPLDGNIVNHKIFPIIKYIKGIYLGYFSLCLSLYICKGT